MRGAALADIHLGFRRLPATRAGRPLREFDVEEAWIWAVNSIRSRAEAHGAPYDLCTLAGDIMDDPIVSDYARAAYLRGVRILSEAARHVAIVLGNHDVARTAAVLSPVYLACQLDLPNVHVVGEKDPKTLRFDDLSGVRVECIPDTGGEGHTIKNIDEDEFNVLVAHAAVSSDRLPTPYAKQATMDVAQMAALFDVVCLGDYHEFQTFGANAFYSGALERVSNNIWQETDPKGYVEWHHDGRDAQLDFIEYPYPRPMYDFSLDERDPENVNEWLRLFLEDERAEDALVRLVLPGWNRGEDARLDWSTIRSLKRRCAHFQFDRRSSERNIVDLGDRRERPEPLTLYEQGEKFFADDEEAVRTICLEKLKAKEADAADEVSKRDEVRNPEPEPAEAEKRVCRFCKQNPINRPESAIREEMCHVCDAATYYGIKPKPWTDKEADE